MVNKVNVLHMAQVFATRALAMREKNPIGYNQGTWRSTDGEEQDWTGRGCGTVACVAGWTVAQLKPRKFREDCDLESIAASLLGLDSDQEDILFHPDYNPMYGREESTCAVAAVLKHLAETNEVDWAVGRRAVEEDAKRKADSDGE